MKLGKISEMKCEAQNNQVKRSNWKVKNVWKEENDLNKKARKCGGSCVFAIVSFYFFCLHNFA